jgi:GNAT superfamily N-acetyltransferase
VNAIRPLEPADLPAVAALYAEIDKNDPDGPLSGYIDFFNRTLIEHPLADPEIPALVYDDPRDGVVGMMGSHPRQFIHGDRTVRLACSGPLIVHPDHRPRGLGALLLRRYVAGPQDMTVNDRALDMVHDMWSRLGGVTDSAGSMSWERKLAPVGAAASAFALRMIGRERPPGAALYAGIDAALGRRLRPALPSSGETEKLTHQDLADVIDRCGRAFELRPAYDAEYLSALFGVMDEVVLGDLLVRRLVRTDDGRAAGAYVMYLRAGGPAHVMQVVASGDDIGLTLDHLFHEAAAAGAVTVSGRVEPHLVSHLRERSCRIDWHYWSMLQSRDPSLVAAVLSGKALLTRLDGEWWMRPRPQGSSLVEEVQAGASRVAAAPAFAMTTTALADLGV